MVFNAFVLFQLSQGQQRGGEEREHITDLNSNEAQFIVDPVDVGSSTIHDAGKVKILEYNIGNGWNDKLILYIELIFD